MKNKKGFTLVELIGVITLLSLIALVVYPAITSVMKNSREKAYNDQIELLVKAAKQWGVENADELPDSEGGIYSLSISKLLEDGYITNDEVIDPRNTETTLTGVILIRNTSNQFVYEYVGETFQTVIALWLKQNASLENDTYTGSNPDNYVQFNNELWRMIKVNTDGSVKIIRNESLPALEWDKSGTGLWKESTLRKYLNETYYNTIVQNLYIIESTWCIGTLGNNNCTFIDSANVGLITANEYVNASGDENCLETNIASCGNSNYLSGTYYTITRGDENNYNKIYRVQNGTLLNDKTSAEKYDVRPVVNLNASVKITGGSGKADDPFRISL